MPRLTWDAVGSKTYETGIDHAVLYVPGQTGIPWNGLTAVTDTPSGGEVNPYYLDGVKYLDAVNGEDFHATLEAFTYPDEFEICQGVQQVQLGLFATAQPHSTFGLSYRTKIGNDVDGSDKYYKLHLVYNATVATPDKNYKTQTTVIDLETFKWDIVAVPMPVPGMKPTAHVIADSRYMDPDILEQLELLLYGDDQITAHLPSVENLINLIVVDGSITIIDNGNGTWTAIGPNEFITMLDDKTFQIAEANAVYLDADTYTIASST